MTCFESLLVDAKPNAGSFGDVGSPFALKVRQQEQPAGPGRDASRFGGELLMGPTEILADHLGRHRDIHGTQQWKPAIGGITERGDFALGIDDWFLRAGINSAAGP